MASEEDSMKKLIGFVFVIIIAMIILLKVSVFNAAQKKSDVSAYNVIIGGGIMGFLLLARGGFI